MRRVLFAISFLAALFTGKSSAETPLSPGDVIAQSTKTDWRQPEAHSLLYVTLDRGTVVFELAPDFAPQHITNLRTLVADKYFDGLAIIRSHDNYVVQWGDPQTEPDLTRPLGKAKDKIEVEVVRQRNDLLFTPISSRDAYAPEVGFVRGFAAGADTQNAWLTHCYGALGVGRGLEPDSGNASSLYVVTGHAPRHLDRNVTLIGRVISGIELLSSLPRGTEALGFYAKPEQQVHIRSVRFGDQVPKSERVAIEIMRTDSDAFAHYVKARSFRNHPWFINPVGKIEICNVGVPSRAVEQ